MYYVPYFLRRWLQWLLVATMPIACAARTNQ